MADNKLLNFQYGQFSKLPAMSAATAGTVFVTTDEQAMYIDLPNKDGALARVRIGDIIVYQGTSDIEPPYHKGFYYFIDENALMHYDERSNEWERINKEADFSLVEAEIEALEGELTTVTNSYNTHVTSTAAKFTNLQEAVNARVTTTDFEAFKTANTNVINGVSERAEKGIADAATAQAQADKGVADAAAADAKAVKAQGDIDAWKEAHANDYTNTAIDNAIATAKQAAIDAASADATAKANVASGLANAAQAKADEAYELAEGKTTMAEVENKLASYETIAEVNKKISAVRGETTQTVASAYAKAEAAAAAAEAADALAAQKTTMAEVQKYLGDEKYAKKKYVDDQDSALLGSTGDTAGTATIHGALNAAKAADALADSASKDAKQALADAAAAQQQADLGVANASKAQTAADNAQKAIDDWKTAHANDMTNTQITDAIATAKQGAIDSAKVYTDDQIAIVDALADDAKDRANDAYELAEDAVAAAGVADQKAENAQTDITNWKKAHANDYTNAQIDNFVGALEDADDILDGKIDGVKATAEAALPMAGTPTGKAMGGNIDMGAHLIKNLAAPAENADAANKQYVDEAIAAGIAANDAMTFKGVVDCGQDGGTTTQPAGVAANKGDTWKVARAGTYAGIAAKVGDLLIYNGEDGTDVASNWVHISSGYEDDYLQKLYVADNAIQLNDGIGSSVGGFKVVSGNPDNLLIEVTQGTGNAPIHTITATMVWKSFD